LPNPTESIQFGEEDLPLLPSVPLPPCGLPKKNMKKLEIKSFTENVSELLAKIMLEFLKDNDYGTCLNNILPKKSHQILSKFI
jgi:hypothetical protein